MTLCELFSLWRVSIIVFWTIAKSAVFPIIVVSKNKRYPEFILYVLGVDRLSAPILSIFTIIDIGHFQNRFADNFYLFIMQTNILFTGDIIYWWINNTGEII